MSRPPIKSKPIAPAPVGSLNKYRKTKEEKERDVLADLGALFLLDPNIHSLTILLFTPWGYNDGDPQRTRFEFGFNGETPLVSSAYKHSDYPEKGLYREYDDLGGDDESVQIEKITGLSPEIQALQVGNDAREILKAMRFDLEYVFGNGFVLRIDRDDIGDIRIIVHDSYDTEY